MSKSNEPLFESNANASIARVTATFGQRGTEYGDTWRNAQWLALKAVAAKYHVKIPPHVVRALAAAVMFDVKYARLEGGYKDDTMVDGCAYGLNLAEEVNRTDMAIMEAAETTTQTLARVLSEPGAMERAERTLKSVAPPENVPAAEPSRRPLPSNASSAAN